MANADKNQGISVASQQVRDIDHASADLTAADKNQTTVIGSSILGNVDNAAVNVEHIEDASNIDRSMIQELSATQANMTDLEKNSESTIGDSILGNMNSVDAEAFITSDSKEEQKIDDVSYIEIKNNEKES